MRNAIKSIIIKCCAITIVILLTVAFLPARSVNAAACTFTSKADGSWSAGGTWTATGAACSTYPGQAYAGDIVEISGTNAITLDVSPAYSLASLQLGGKSGGNNNTGRLTFNSSSHLTVAGSVNIGHGGRQGFIIMTAGGMLTAQDLAWNNGALISGTGTVELTATNTLPSGLTTYNNLIINGGTTTLMVNTILSGNLTINSGTLSSGTYNLSVAGNWTNNGAFSAGTGTVTFNGTSPQYLVGATSFYRLTVNNSRGLYLLANQTVTNLLTFQIGKIDTGSNVLILTGSHSGSGETTYVNGKIQRPFSGTSLSFVYPVGDSTNYAPVTLTFGSVGASGNVTAEVSSADCGTIATSDIDPDLSVNHCWSLTNAEVGFTNYSAIFNYGYGTVLDTGVNPANLVVEKYGNNAWSTPLSATFTSTTATVSNVLGMSDFAIGQLKRTATTTELGSLTGVTYGTAVTFTASVSPVPPDGGRVDFYDDDVEIGYGTLSDGEASYSTGITDLGAGTHPITARFEGDLAFSPSTSAEGSQVVAQKDLTITGLTAEDKVYDGEFDVTIDATSAQLDGLVGDEEVDLYGEPFGAFEDKNVGTDITVSVTGFHILDPNYNLVLPAETTASITPYLLTPQITASDKEYDGTESAEIASRSFIEAVVGSEEVSLEGGTAAFVSADAGLGKTVTASGFSLSGADSSNYALEEDYAETTADITPLPITIIPTDGQSKYFGEEDPLLEYEWTPELLNGDSIDGLLGRIPGDDADTYDFDIGTLDAGPNYTLTVEPGHTFEVKKAAQILEFITDPPIHVKVDDIYNPAASGGGSGNPVVFSIDESSDGICSYNSETGEVNFLAVGTCQINADQAGDANYKDALQVYQSVEVCQNNAPVITDDQPIAASIDAGGTLHLALHASDVDGDTISWGVTDPSTNGGSVSVPEENTGTTMGITYQPAEGFIGVDTFDVEVLDGYGGSDSVTVTVTVNPPMHHIYLPLIWQS